MTESRRDAEREAVAYVLQEAPPDADLANVTDAAIAALDAVRSPQSEDHGRRDPQGEDHETGVTPEMVDAARAAYRDYQPITLAKYSEAWQFARMRAALVAAFSRCPSPVGLKSTCEKRPECGCSVECRAYLSRRSAPERDTERLVDRLWRILSAALADARTLATPQDRHVEDHWREAIREALAEFGGSDVAPEHDAENPTMVTAADYETYIRPHIARLVEALREIANRPTVERNPDGDDQAAWTMQMIAREALAEFGGSDVKPPDSRVSHEHDSRGDD